MGGYLYEMISDMTCQGEIRVITQDDLQVVKKKKHNLFLAVRNI